ncbi:hypothetical protein TanjilG_07301 [Lupinus angustifolius]|uniref:Uncharacterized protein n=1 Tax=Lupinus angustifolius TaxID=3871 RepID=A0A4P1RIJ1_LUPAN|nr:hypothetical protein TanjilG_07301 [Lupinus angustifolius]
MRDEHNMRDDLEDSMEIDLDQIASSAGNTSSRAIRLDQNGLVRLIMIPWISRLVRPLSLDQTVQAA